MRGKPYKLGTSRRSLMLSKREAPVATFDSFFPKARSLKLIHCVLPIVNLRETAVKEERDLLYLASVYHHGVARCS